MVPGAGLEPARPQWPGDFKSPVSTNFTTRAKSGVQRARRIPCRTLIPTPNRPLRSDLILTTRARSFFCNIASKGS